MINSRSLGDNLGRRLPARLIGIVFLVSLMHVGQAMDSACLAKKPVDWEQKLEKGYHELSIGNVDKAIDMFRDKVKSYPDSGACHTALGSALKKRGKLAEARNEFQTATAVEPGYPNAYYELGAMLESDREYAAAAKAFEKYNELSPDPSRKATVTDRIRFCKEHI